MKREAGFTLIELAVILAIIGLLMGTGFGVYRMMSSAQSDITNRNLVEELRETVLEFAARTRRFPTNAEFAVIAGKTEDFQRNQVLYLPMNADNTSYSLCEATTTSLEKVDADTGAVTTNVALFLISGGEDGAVLDSDPAGGITVARFNLDIAGHDDIAEVLTLWEVQQKIGCTVTALRVLTTSLPTAGDNETYSAEFSVAGGASSAGYEWCLEAVSSYPEAFFTADSGAVPYLADCSDKALWIHTESGNAVLSGEFGAVRSGSYRVDLLVVPYGGDVASAVRQPLVLTVLPHVERAFDNGSGTGSPVEVDNITFSDNITGFVEPNVLTSTVEGGKDFAAIINDNTTGDKRLEFGVASSNFKYARGCIWYASPVTLRNNTIVSFFTAKLSQNVGGEGFTYTLRENDGNLGVCGGVGNGLGYGTNYGDNESLDISKPLPGQSMAFEFDLNGGNGKTGECGTTSEDPNTCINLDPSYYVKDADHHVAILRPESLVGSTIHNNDQTDACNGIEQGCMFITKQWLKSNTAHRVRVEVQSGYDMTQCGTCSSGRCAKASLWIEGYRWGEADTNFAPSDFSDTTVSYLESNKYTTDAVVTDCFELPPAMDTVLFGFTASTGQQQLTLIIDQFALKVHR